MPDCTLGFYQWTMNNWYLLMTFGSPVHCELSIWLTQVTVRLLLQQSNGDNTTAVVTG